MLINIKMRLIQVAVVLLVIHLAMISITAEAAERDAEKVFIPKEKVITVIKKIKNEMLVTKTGRFELIEATIITDIKEKPVYINQVTLPVEVEIVFQRRRNRKTPPQVLEIILQEEFKLPVQPE